MNLDFHKILIVGDTGFVGAPLADQLSKHFEVIGISRSASESHWVHSSIDYNLVSVEWLEQFKGGAVVFLATKAHAEVPDSNEASRILEFYRRCSKANVGHFIYLSSDSVYGNLSGIVDESVNPKPETAQAMVRHQVENGLIHGKDGHIPWTIIRSPLVIGPRVKGNLKYLLKLARKGVPLPLSGFHQKSSYVGLTTLIQFIKTCIEKNEAKNQLFNVAEAKLYSIVDVYRVLSQINGECASVFYLPLPVIRVLLRILGKISMYNSLTSSKELSIAKAFDRLGWLPLDCNLTASSQPERRY